MIDVPLVEISTNSSHICSRKGPETPKKGPFHGYCIAMKTFENLQLDNCKCYTNETYTVMKLIKMLNLAEEWGVTHRV